MKVTISKKIAPEFAGAIRSALKACTSCEAQNTCNVKAEALSRKWTVVLDVTPRKGHTCPESVREEMLENLADENIEVYDWCWCDDGALLFIKQRKGNC